MNYMVGTKRNKMNEFMVSLSVRVKGFSKEQVEAMEELRHDCDDIESLEVKEVSDGEE